MNRKKDNQSLLKAGLVTSLSEADKLRKQIWDRNESVTDYIRAQAKVTDTFTPPAAHPPGDVAIDPSGVTEMAEIRSLMEQDGLNFVEAKLLKQQLVADGRTVQEYLHADAQLAAFGQDAKPKTLIIFRAAEHLIRIAGSPDKATKAIELYSQLDNPSTEF